MSPASGGKIVAARLAEESVGKSGKVAGLGGSSGNRFVKHQRGQLIAQLG